VQKRSISSSSTPARLLWWRGRRPVSRCGTHDALREQGFPGCDVFDCFGAGQHVVQVAFGFWDVLTVPLSVGYWGHLVEPCVSARRPRLG